MAGLPSITPSQSGAIAEGRFGRDDIPQSAMGSAWDRGLRDLEPGEQASVSSLEDGLPDPVTVGPP